VKESASCPAALELCYLLLHTFRSEPKHCLCRFPACWWGGGGRMVSLLNHMSQFFV
jgi:hypothetical protein